MQNEPDIMAIVAPSVSFVYLSGCQPHTYNNVLAGRSVPSRSLHLVFRQPMRPCVGPCPIKRLIGTALACALR